MPSKSLVAMQSLQVMTLLCSAVQVGLPRSHGIRRASNRGAVARLVAADIAGAG